jgi:hypothetical protein
VVTRLSCNALCMENAFRGLQAPSHCVVIARCPPMRVKCGHGGGRRRAAASQPTQARPGGTPEHPSIFQSRRGWTRDPAWVGIGHWFKSAATEAIAIVNAARRFSSPSPSTQSGEHSDTSTREATAQDASAHAEAATNGRRRQDGKGMFSGASEALTSAREHLAPGELLATTHESIEAVRPCSSPLLPPSPCQHCHEVSRALEE